jgi:hypothetical protein
MSQKKLAKVCGQTKIANVALSPSQGERGGHLHPDPCWEGRDEAVWLKKANPAKK